MADEKKDDKVIFLRLVLNSTLVILVIIVPTSINRKFVYNFLIIFESTILIVFSSNPTRSRKRLEANKEEKSYDLFTSYLNLWYDYVNACNSMYTEYIRNASKITEYWLDLFSKLWSVQYKDKVKVG